jgi:hypothetical protein
VRILYDIVGSVAIGISGITVGRQFIMLVRSTSKQRHFVARQVITAPAGQATRINLGLLAAGLYLLTSGWLDSAGKWLIASVLAAIVVWDRGVWLNSLMATHLRGPKRK